MKLNKYLKTTLLATAVALPVSTFASSSQIEGYYIQGELGWGKTEVKEAEVKLKDDGTVGKISLGYDFGDNRIALDYTKTPNFKNKVENKKEQETIDAKLKTHSIGISLIQELDTGLPFTPYIGVRVSHNIVKNNVKFTSPSEKVENKITKSKFGYGVLAGVDVSITDNLILNVGAEYNYLGKFDNVKIQEYGARAGVRFIF